MSTEYFERGGLRWGQSFWTSASNATWPFATLRITPETVDLHASAWPLVDEHFSFAATDIRVFRRRRGIISVGVQLEHTRADYPPSIVFWTFHSRRLLAAAQAAGYQVREV
jgi:hypothetical protein